MEKVFGSYKETRPRRSVWLQGSLPVTPRHLLLRSVGLCAGVSLLPGRDVNAAGGVVEPSAASRLTALGGCAGKKESAAFIRRLVHELQLDFVVAGLEVCRKRESTLMAGGPFDAAVRS
jgi:hypothetical protein